MASALIFDMDGVIVNNNRFHKLAWERFCSDHGCSLSEEDLRRQVYGKTDADALNFIFDSQLSAKEVWQFAEQKERLYQELFLPHLQPVPGLISFLAQAADRFDALAVATSAPPMNVDFVLDNLGIRKYFSLIIDETMVSRGKPDPEIYLTAAARLGVQPADCIVIEDSLAGIQAARSAGMKVIGITTTHSKYELIPRVDRVIDDFTGLEEQLDQMLLVL